LRGTWLYTWQEYVRMVALSGPRLVRPFYAPDTGKLVRVEVDLETPARITDPLVLKGIWTQGRLSPHGTIESRACPSMQPGYAARSIGMILKVVTATIRWVNRRGRPSTYEDVCELYGALHDRVGDFVPEKPLTEKEWSDLAGLTALGL